MTGNGYTPIEAAAMANLPLKSVHKLIENRLIEPVRRRMGGRVLRFLNENQLIYLRLESDGVQLLPIETRRKLAKAIELSAHQESVALADGPALVVRVKLARKRVQQDLARLKKAADMAARDPEILRGTPVYRGTRIPIALVAEMLAQGASPEEILAGYPALNLEKIRLAPLYVRAFPHKGRPAARPWARQKAVRVSHLRGSKTSAS